MQMEPIEPPEIERRPWLLGQLWRETQGFFVSMFQGVWAGFSEQITNLLKVVWRDTQEAVETGTATIFLDTLRALRKSGWIDKETENQLRELEKLPFPFDTFVLMYIALTLLTTYAGTTSAFVSSDLRKDLASRYTPETARPEHTLQAAFIAPEKTKEIRDELKKAGYDDRLIDLMFLAAYRLYDENMIRDLFLRGVLSTDQMYMRMRELGYTDTRIKEVIQSWEIIPGPQDLLTMVAKEAFEPEAIALMGLGDEFPEEQVSWLQKQGISRDWALKYWYSHWDQPSIGQGFDMLHRGQIGLKELDMLFRTVEIPPFWRDKLTAIAYVPFTRVDVRRMHDLGVLTDEELIRSYMDLGYDEEKATAMADFTIRYNQEHDRDLTKSEILRGYKEKIIPKEDAIDLLVQIDFHRPQAEYLVAFEDYKEQQEYQDEVIGAIKDRYQNNFITDFEARGELNKLNLPAQRVDVLMERWKTRKLVDAKIPSKSDLDKFLRTKIIDLDTYRLEMQRLGYSFKYTQWYEQLVRKKGG